MRRLVVVAAVAAVVAMAGDKLLGGEVGPAAPARELVLDLGNKVTMKLVLIRPGKFTMGSPEDEKGRFDNETQHEVTISKAFYMGVFEVTRGQFASFVKDSNFETKGEKRGWAIGWDGKGFDKVNGAAWRKPGFQQTDEHPVVCVSWNDAAAFCKWLSGKSGKTVRLPTEAEWEYACRAGTKTAYQWGDDPDQGTGWYNALDTTAHKTFNCLPVIVPFNGDDGFVFTAAVGRFKANAFGLYDMHGNVWEWCQDWLGDYPKEAETNPTGPADGRRRVIRGGSWYQIPRYCRSAVRSGGAPDKDSIRIGFRVACEVR